nr:PhzF family phenazine biosynthesis isomerase [Clostridia bacterium]
MKFYIADVFTETKFGGNPAGIILIDEGKDFPDPELMKKASAELRYSETVFVKKLDSSTFHLRYFTIEDEIELCGHATIGAFALMARKGIIRRNGEYTARTLSGDLEIKLQEGFVMMEVGRPKVLRRIEMKDETLELYKIMGLDYQPPLVQC